LIGSTGLSFKGVDIYGKGFTFNDDDELANPLAKMERLISDNKKNADRIFPYIGGDEINDSPTPKHSRYVINFDIMTEDEARRWPDLMRIIEEKVRPERYKLRDTSDGVRLKKHWWLYSRSRPELMAALRNLNRVLVCSQTSKYLSFAFLPSKLIFSQKVVVIASSAMGMFSVLQSRQHNEWSDLLGSSMKDDPVYTPSDCFETFPFPKDYETNPILESAGQTYYDFRADLMVRNNEGLTKTYNRFHDPDERSPDILKLRELHAAMDRAVLDAYGWTDLQPTCEFLLDYEEDDDEEEAGGGRRRKKPWRYRWPDEFRDEVLARLLELNRQRAQEERLSGAAAEGKGKKPKTMAKKSKEAEQPGLF